MPACHAGDRRFESGRVRHHSPLLLTPRPPARTGRSLTLEGRHQRSSVTLPRVTIRDPGYAPRTPSAPRRRPGWLLPVAGLAIGLGAAGALVNGSAAPSPSGTGAPVAV